MFKLASCIVQEGRLPVPDAIGWVTRLLGLLEQMHAKGVVHGAISAKAIQVLGPGCGAAGFIPEPDKVQNEIAYHSLERMVGGAPSPEDDTWAAGVLLYHALTGSLPFPGTAAAQITARILGSRTGRLEQTGIDHPALQTLVDQALARTQEQRIRSAAGLRAALVALDPSVAELPPLKLGVPAAYEQSEPDDEEAADVLMTAVVSAEELMAQARELLSEEEQATLEADLMIEDEPTTTRDSSPPGHPLVGGLPPSPATDPLAASGASPAAARPDPLAASGAAPAYADPLAASGANPAAAGGAVSSQPAPKAARSLFGVVVVVGLVCGVGVALGAWAAFFRSPTPAPASDGSATAAPTASAETTPSATASAAETATAKAPANVPACVRQLFPADTFAGNGPSFGYVCNQADARKGGAALRAEVQRTAKSGQGLTPARLEWVKIGWHEMAVFALARQLCCAEPPALATALTPPACPLDATLDELAAAAAGDDEAATDEALAKFAKATQCLAGAGAAPNFGQRGAPSGGAATFKTILARARKANGR